MISRKYGRVVLSGWLFPVLYACYVSVMLVVFWQPGLPSAFSTVSSGGALFLILWIANRARSLNIERDNAFKIGVLRYAANMLDTVEGFYQEMGALGGDRTIPDDKKAERAAGARTRAYGRLQEGATKMMGLCYNNMATSSTLHDIVELARGPVVVELYEQDNPRGNKNCAEKYLLEPVAGILGSEYFAAGRGSYTEEDLAVVERIRDKIAERVNAWKAAQVVV